MERGKTSEAAAGAFGSVYLFFPVSYVASLTAGVQASGFTSRAPHSSRVCERGRRRRTTSSPLISPLLSASLLQTALQARTFSWRDFHRGKVWMTTMKAAIAGTVLPFL